MNSSSCRVESSSSFSPSFEWSTSCDKGFAGEFFSDLTFSTAAFSSSSFTSAAFSFFFKLSKKARRLPDTEEVVAMGTGWTLLFCSAFGPAFGTTGTIVGPAFTLVDLAITLIFFACVSDFGTSFCAIERSAPEAAWVPCLLHSVTSSFEWLRGSFALFTFSASDGPVLTSSNEAFSMLAFVAIFSTNLDEAEALPPPLSPDACTPFAFVPTFSIVEDGAAAASSSSSPKLSELQSKAGASFFAMGIGGNSSSNCFLGSSAGFSPAPAWSLCPGRLPPIRVGPPAFPPPPPLPLLPDMPLYPPPSCPS
mmetsp:Transcript_31613/g.82506  ORF Transcript_31613/g.82506 Transcript_31613/m.82506 type:complete len:308 (+) Transcript_31613:355-1278(+)